ncbi:MAG: NADH-ubiquinone oxidoreductase-F iron-sulfur binding region domain-containing protein, partial [Pirellulaceae bacterium]
PVSWRDSIPTNSRIPGWRTPWTSGTNQHVPFSGRRNISRRNVALTLIPDLDQYLRHDGFQALHRCLEENAPEAIIEEVRTSGLRGRGGAGFPTHIKWQKVREARGDVKYLICNGDEGDPGAFMDRMLLESFPYRILEGMAIAARAAGAHEAFLYIRAEYPLAVQRVREAIRHCEEHGYAGRGILGTDFDLTFRVLEGAGAFVCGEETALINSAQGNRGTPTLRPPYPAESGLWGRPTLINNVETLACIPWIFRHGGQAFGRLGTEKSKGTKVFALAGKVQRGGLIEVPMGMSLQQIVDEIGGGVVPGREFKAVQVGGPSGGCVPARLADTPVDFEALSSVGAIMGSGGLVVLDNTDCMVDIARYFLRFTQDQSCGKCTFCRIGTKRMLEILDRICAGEGRKGDLKALEQLAQSVVAGSICGLGKTAPNPVLSTLTHFRHEYEAHLDGKCPAGKCAQLVRYEITSDCIGCTLCAQHCPVSAIPMTPYRRHTIDLDLCTRCDTCRQVCPEDAVTVIS